MNIKKADLFFTCREGSFVTEAIQFFERGGEPCPYTHVAIITEWPKIISADSDGVVEREILEDELYKFIVLTANLSDQQRDEIIESARKDVERGIKYDFYSIGALAIHLPIEIDEESFYCSEHVYVKYKKKGCDLLKRNPIFVTPRDLFHSGLLEEVPTEEVK